MECQSLGDYGFRERADKKEYGLPTWERPLLTPLMRGEILAGEMSVCISSPPSEGAGEVFQVKYMYG
jgi:hypothetical protein